MGELKDKEITGKIIAAAVNVHRNLGPGFLEAIYESALCIELEAIPIPFKRQKAVSIYYLDRKIGEHRLDLVVAKKVIVELKSVKDLENVHFVIVRSYLKAANLESGLLLNFATIPLTIRRVGREKTNPDQVIQTVDE